MLPFSTLQGKTLKSIEGKVGDERMTFLTDDGERYHLTYYQDCCANCAVEDICGDLNDLIGSRIELAEEVQSRARREDAPSSCFQGDSFTWTFYKLATLKGAVTIRWFGSSNGYYSETATFEKDVIN